MTFTPETIIGKKVLDLTTMRHQLLANNISNANTPKYKRTDLSFGETLEAMSVRQASVENNTPPDMLSGEMIRADLSRGKKLTFSHGNSGGDMGVEFARSNIGFDYSWYGHGADVLDASRDKNLTKSDVVEDMNPILIKTKNSERLDGNNVSVDLEVSEMIKNTSYYNMLVSIVSGDFRIYRTIISAR